MTENANGSRASALPVLPAPWLFFVLVFCWTWVVWLGAALSGVSGQTSAGRALVLLGALGPMLGGLGFGYIAQSRERRRDYWSRIVDPRRIGAGWWGVILLLVPVLLAIAVAADVASGGSQAPSLIAARLMPLMAAPATIAPLLLGVFVMGPLPEELGWRGYALDRLQERWSVPVASLILGAVWAVWHLPLFFIRDSFHFERGAWSGWFWLFLVQVVAMAVVMGWIFNSTRRSTLAAIVFHFVANVAYIVADQTERTNLYATVLWVALAIAAVRLMPRRAP